MPGIGDPVPICVFVSGGGSNLEAILAGCAVGAVQARVVAVVSDDPEAYGLHRARRRGIPAIGLQPGEYGSREDHERAVLQALAPHEPRLAVLAGYMRLVTPVLLGHFRQAGRLGVINIHPADTRAYQGTHGYEFAFGLTKKGPRLERTFITVHFVDDGMDTGPIIAQVEVPIHSGDTLEQLRERGLAVEHQLFPRVVDQVARGEIAQQGREIIRR